MDWFLGSAIIFVGIGAAFTYLLYKFANHELRHRKHKI